MQKPDLARFSQLLKDPFKLIKLCWPDLRLYDKQAELIRSVEDNDETIVPAGNDLGKDFSAGLIAVVFFCTRSPCRVITTSSGQTQLKSVLWGEIRRFVSTSKFPLPIQLNELEAKQWVYNKRGDKILEPRSYIRGIVTVDPENLQGHHLERTEDGRPRVLGILDEASGIESIYYEALDTCAHRKLIIGNPLPCSNFFFAGVKKGDVPSDVEPGKFDRKVIRIKAEDSPNVRLALLQKERGLPITNEAVIPGVLSYSDYLKRKKHWDIVRQCIGLGGEFYEGAEVLLYPPDWLNRAEQVAADLERRLGKRRKPIGLVTMGVDPGEGEAESAWCIGDEAGILKLLAFPTVDTTSIPTRTIQLIEEYDLDPADVCMDRGGGGKQHADQMRSLGYNIRTIGFGSAVTDPYHYRRKLRSAPEAEGIEESRYSYKNRRAEMYGLVRYELLDPQFNEDSYGIPAEYTELRRQLAPLPLLYDGRKEGQLYLPPKTKKDPRSKEKTLKDILGCSPDRADAFVLMTYAQFTKYNPRVISVY